MGKPDNTTWGTISNRTNRHPGVLAGGPEKTVSLP